MSFYSRFTQNVAASTLNSSNANLSALATFTGTAESTLGIAGIQVSLYTTQNCTVYVDQSPDGINWDLVDSYNYRYRSVTDHNFGITVQAVSSYFRVRVTNISATIATTIFRLQTALCPIVEAVPRSLSAEGNLKVGVYEIEDEQGNKVKISPNGALKISKVVRLVGASFSGTTIDTNFWTSTTAAGGTGVQTGGQFEMRTNTTPNGASSLLSTRSARYINGVPNYCRIQADYGGAGVANNTKRWGCFTGTAGSPTNGAMFELIDGLQTLAVYKAGAPDRISNGLFNGDYGATLNEIPAGLQTFEIIYNNRYIYFYFNNVLVHKYEAASATWSDTLSLPCRAENYNTSGSATDTSLKIRSFVIMRYGEAESRPHWKYYHGANTGVLKYGAGTLHKVTVNQTANGSQVYLYDALSATNPIALLTFTGTGQQASLQYGLDFYTGLYVAVANANTDVTIVYE